MVGLEVADYNDKLNSHWQCKPEAIVRLTEINSSKSKYSLKVILNLVAPRHVILEILDRYCEISRSKWSLRSCMELVQRRVTVSFSGRHFLGINLGVVGRE